MRLLAFRLFISCLCPIGYASASAVYNETAFSNVTIVDHDYNDFERAIDIDDFSKNTLIDLVDSPSNMPILNIVSSFILPRRSLELNVANVHAHGVADTIVGLSVGPYAGYTVGLHIGKVRSDWTSALAQHGMTTCSSENGTREMISREGVVKHGKELSCHDA